MSRLRDIPPDTNEKEKAVGGVITFGQLGWLLGGLVLAIFTYIIIYAIVRVQVVAIIFAIPALISGAPFALYKKHDMSLFEYLTLKKKYKKKSKYLINGKDDKIL